MPSVMGGGGYTLARILETETTFLNIPFSN